MDCLNAPGVGQKGRRNAESDDIRQRVKLFAEIGGGICESSDAAIQPVKNDGPSNLFGRVIKRCQRDAGAGASSQKLSATKRGNNGDVSAYQRSDGEYAGQNIDAASLRFVGANLTPLVL